MEKEGSQRISRGSSRVTRGFKSPRFPMPPGPPSLTRSPSPLGLASLPGTLVPGPRAYRVPESRVHWSLGFPRLDPSQLASPPNPPAHYASACDKGFTHSKIRINIASPLITEMPNWAQSFITRPGEVISSNLRLD